MSRNNPDRTGAHTADADAIIPATQQAQQSTGEAFSFVVPTEFVELPSKGTVYAENHPLHGQESVEIRHMTTKEEDILTSRALLKQGVALDRVIQNLMVDKRIKPDDLIIGDKNAIIVAARISGYGGDYGTSITCPACGATAKYDFNLHDSKVYDGADAASLDVTRTENGTFHVELPLTKLNVEFRLLTGADEKRIVKGMEMERKRKSPEKNVSRQLKTMIASVNGEGSPAAINELVDNMPSLDARHLRLAYKLAAPNIDLTQNYECSECGHEQEMEVPLTADFFWPDR